MIFATISNQYLFIRSLNTRFSTLIGTQKSFSSCVKVL